MKEALGMVETRGLIGSIEAADAMVKAANVRLIGKVRSVPVWSPSWSGRRGRQGAVDAAPPLPSGWASSGVHGIPRPHSDVEFILPHLDRGDDEE